MTVSIRPERPADEHAIGALISTAFALAEHSDGTEARIVSGLRAAGALAVSLVAEVDGQVVGHVAFSPVTIDGRACDWFGLGPVAVSPDHQRRGIANALIRRGLAMVEEGGSRGCVVLGDPSYYQRFGFIADGQLALDGVPPEYFQSLTFGDHGATGLVAYHSAFGTS